MSSKNFRVLQPKSVYNNLEFYKDAYSTTGKFSVFIPKEQDFVNEMIERDLAKTKSSFINASRRVASQPFIKLDDTDIIQRDKFINDVDCENNYILNHVQASTPKVQTVSKSVLINPKIRTQITEKFNHPASAFKTSTKFKQAKMKQLEKLRQSLYFDELTKTIPKSTIRNDVIEDIVQDGDVFLSKSELMSSIHKLKQLKLLKNHDNNVNRFPGIGKVTFIYNDYHTKSTNNGYSRNFGGVFFTR